MPKDGKKCQGQKNKCQGLSKNANIELFGFKYANLATVADCGVRTCGCGLRLLQWRKLAAQLLEMSNGS
jgi:hypothetical protein